MVEAKINSHFQKKKEKVLINKNNFDAVLKEFKPSAKINVPNTLVDDSSDISIELTFKSMNDFKSEQVAKNIPQLRSLLAIRNLLRDLNPNLLNHATSRYGLEKIVKMDVNIKAQVNTYLLKPSY